MASGGKSPPTEVSTVAGDGSAESRDGIGTAASLNRPYAIVESADGKSLIFTEAGPHHTAL